MTWQGIEAEQKAIESLMALYAQAKVCKRLYEEANMAPPEPLQRFLGIESVTKDQAKPASVKSVAHVPAPNLGDDLPAGYQNDWVRIMVSEASPTTVALAVLRADGGHVRYRDLVEAVTSRLPNVPKGSIANLGTSLAEKQIIRREDEGWILLDKERAGYLHAGWVWGLPAVFTKQELAAHRRHAILHVLKHYAAGMQTVQLVEQLRNCPWVKAPINKDLLKADLQILAEANKIKQQGNSRKWVLKPEGDD